MRFHGLAGALSRSSIWMNPYKGVRSSECGPFRNLGAIFFFSRITCNAPFSFYYTTLRGKHYTAFALCIIPVDSSVNSHQQYRCRWEELQALKLINEVPNFG